MLSSFTFNPPVIAHRGASAYAPENTMAAFIKAVQCGVKWVEFDVVLALSGEAIVFHDDTLHRITNKSGCIGDYPYTYLSTLDAGVWFAPSFSGERIPLLRQVLGFLKDMHMSVNVEVKPLPGQEERTVIQTLKVIQTIFPLPNPAILFSSFSVETLQHLRRYSPDSALGLLLHEWDPEWEKICTELDCVSVHVYDAILTEKKALKIKTMGKQLLCYTVNDPLRALELYSWGVDAVFSDNPDKIIAALPL